MIDLHIHILPGLDDGPPDMAEAVAMARLAAADGTTTAVAAPHMRGDLYDVTRADVLDGVRALGERLQAEGVPLAVAPGADIHLEPDVPDLLRQGRLVTVGDAGRFVLLELPQGVFPQGLREVLFAVETLGITPIITHPERNFEVQADPDAVRPLVEGGAVLQLTAGSITGDLGRSAARTARRLLEAGLGHLVASDAHTGRAYPQDGSVRGRLPGLARARALVERLLSVEEAEAIFVHRPRRVLAGEDLDLPEPTGRRGRGRGKRTTTRPPRGPMATGPRRGLSWR